MNEKRGEITTKQIVTIIILILSFSVILFLIFRLDLGKTTNAEICRNSVLLKAKSENLFSSGNLDCKTNYVCIGGNCEGFSETSSVEANTKKESMEALAKEMEQCWWMFGEGEIDYTRGFNLADKNLCSVCSIVSFGHLEEEISYDEFYDYLEDNQKSSSQTYLQYFYKGGQIEERYFEDSFEEEKTYFVIISAFHKGLIGGESIKEKIQSVAGKTPVELPSFSISFRSVGDDETEKLLSPVMVFENTPENYEAIGCDEFVTKA